ncbi:hypothetical protein [Candidatus Lokiarchaeum ossiferum]|uniref:hypothetical protein n=1 Tax=Candidatus Lokiarchaeum ossiferum TaxID=2951803 RepID=UPI00352D8CE2
MTIMGRTLPSFRPALDMEIQSWINFKRGLHLEDRPLFDQIMRYAKMHGDAGSLAARFLISENIWLSALIEQQKLIDKLSEKIEQLRSPTKVGFLV